MTTAASRALILHPLAGQHCNAPTSAIATARKSAEAVVVVQGHRHAMARRRRSGE